ARRVPVLANIRPGGDWLMEDFYYAGGLPGLLSRLTDLLHLDRITVTGRPLADSLAEARVHNDDVIRPRDNPVASEGGVCVLHGAPESHVGGPLALVRDGDLITLDVPSRTLQLQVDDAELERRLASWAAPAPRFERGYGALYAEHITQADEGCDFDFLARA